MNIKSGISLILLVITIIVIIILAGAVILNLINNTPIKQANQSIFQTNVNEYKSELIFALTNEYILDNSLNLSSFNAGIWNGGITGDTIKKYIPSITSTDGVKFEIQSGKLVYVGSDSVEENWLEGTGIISGDVIPIEDTVVGVIAAVNKTFSGATTGYSYDNPVIPAGFLAVNTMVASWNNLASDYDKGLVVQDASGNQFVWVPVNGSTVKYAKWCITGEPYTNTYSDSLPFTFNATNITTTYKGFYIARYEAMFDYNGGIIRVASKKSIDKTTEDWVATRNNSYTGYLWNYISYEEAKTYSEDMGTRYAYDASKVVTNLITGEEWDTTLKWIQNSSISVTDSIAWGNYSNSISPANITESGSLQISGFSEKWKVKNIYDLAGNTSEWNNEEILGNSSFCIVRGGGSSNNGTTIPAAYRSQRYHSDPSDSGSNISFRVALYIK